MLMENKHLNRYSENISAIKKMQLETMVRYCNTSIRMTKAKLTGNTKCQQACRGTGIFIHYWWEYKIVQPLWKEFGSLLQIQTYIYHMIPHTHS